MWQIQMLTGAAKSLVPFQPYLRRLKRNLIPSSQIDEGKSRLALRQGLRMIRLLRESGAALNGVMLEIGSGWFPVVPMLFHLAGAERIIVTDNEKLMDDETIRSAKQFVMSDGTIVCAELALSAMGLEHLHAFDFQYLVPWDVNQIPAHSVDIIVSRAVFEHIPPKDLENIVENCDRILRLDGAMCHIIDNSDHWQHRDNRISRVNFLRYEDGWFWRIACANTQLYQNRWRHSDYLALFRRNGWEAVFQEGEPDPQSLKDLSTLPVARSFRGRDLRDLAVLTSTFVLKRAGE
jgi:hypothetical protein